MREKINFNKIKKAELVKLYKETVEAQDELFIKNLTLEEENKALFEEVNKIKKELKEQKQLIEILKTARKEDAAKVNNAEVIIETFKTKEKALVDNTKARENELQLIYSQQLQSAQNMIKEQNEIIINQFDMLDRLMDQQVYFYQMYKKRFNIKDGDEE
mgnify:FL=1